MRVCDLLHARIIRAGTSLYFCRVGREFWLWRNRGGGCKAEQVIVTHPICVVTMLGHVFNLGFREQEPSLCTTNRFSAMKMLRRMRQATRVCVATGERCDKLEAYAFQMFRFGVAVTVHVISSPRLLKSGSHCYGQAWSTFLLGCEFLTPFFLFYIYLSMSWITLSFTFLSCEPPPVCLGFGKALKVTANFKVTAGCDEIWWHLFRFRKMDLKQHCVYAL